MKKEKSQSEKEAVPELKTRSIRPHYNGAALLLLTSVETEEATAAVGGETDGVEQRGWREDHGQIAFTEGQERERKNIKWVLTEIGRMGQRKNQMS